MSTPEVWLRGAMPGIDPILQPAAHAIAQVREDVERAVALLTDEQLWHRPAGVAAIGFHVLHIVGSLDRLLTYAQGESLSPGQLHALGAERTVHDERPARAQLLQAFASGIDAALRRLEGIPAASLLDAREVGRQRLPSTTLGLVFHAAEHSARHAGQVVTLARIVAA
ncbi:MAG: DinB family protein [Gemmatimonadaceae bacterium]|nr:DinB family protein [Gemmatimonadaceae bacterium]